MQYPRVLSTKVSERDHLAIDLAASARGESRSAFLREAARREADRELRRLRGQDRQRDRDER